MADKMISKAFRDGLLKNHINTLKENNIDYNVKQELNLDDSDLTSTVLVCDNDIEEVKSSKKIVLHGVNHKKLSKRRNKNKMAKNSRKKNRK